MAGIHYVFHVQLILTALVDYHRIDICKVYQISPRSTFIEKFAVLVALTATLTITIVGTGVGTGIETGTATATAAMTFLYNSENTESSCAVDLQSVNRRAAVHFAAEC